MRPGLLVPGAWLAMLITSHAFVTNFSENGSPTRWNLVSPQLTHPNVVNRQTKAIRYFIGETYSAENRVAELQALRNSFLQWQTVPGTILRFEEGGLLNGRVDVNTTDNTNLVFWVKNSTLVNNQLDDISGATGVTFSDYFSDNSLAEADIVFNGTQYGWFPDYNNPVASFYFIESVAVHEIGHFIGLDHTPLGGATMYTRGGTGVNTQAELSADELAALRYLYGNPTLAAALARLAGQVTLNSTGIFGAAVILEDSAGNAAGGTVTRANGQYDFPGLTPGQYGVRVVPLDPVNASSAGRLTTGPDIQERFRTAQTGFLPTTNSPVTLLAGKTITQNFAVTPGNPAFRISRLRSPVTNPEFLIVVNSASPLRPGDRNMFVGIYAPDLPSADATLTVTGDGLIVGPTLFRPNAFVGLNLISVEVSVGTNATPGLRSLILRQGSHLAYANGFLEIQAAFPDINRDGLDDRFQRQYFTTPFAANAAGNLDVDRDGYNNLAEYIAGSNPTDPNSVLRVESIHWDATGATVRWRSAAGRRYQLSSRPHANSSRGWEKVADPVIATGEAVEFLDRTSTTPSRLYRVEALP